MPHVMRRYERSHPWLEFKASMREADPKLWLQLGEIQSKTQYIANVPLRPDVRDLMHRVYLAKGAAATTAIEGNTLTEEEVRGLLDKTIELPPSKEYLAREVDNVIEAFREIATAVLESPGLQPISLGEVLHYNELVLKGLEVAPEVVPGRMRKHEVGVPGYAGAPWEDVDHLMERFLEWLNGVDFNSTDPDFMVATAVLKSVLAHLYLVWIHPFGDGNGRTARLLEVRFLMEAGVPTPAVHLLSNHYNETRLEYYRQLKEASASRNVIPFVAYAVEGLLDGLRRQVQVLAEQNFDIVWRNYVHTQLSGKSASTNRRRDLALALASKGGEPVPFGNLQEISPKVAAAFATKTKKTLSRDINELLRLGLLEKGPGGYRINHNVLRPYMPLQRRVRLPEKATSSKETT